MLYGRFGSGQAEQNDRDGAIEQQISASPK